MGGAGAGALAESLIAPTIEGWIEQWNPVEGVASVIGAVDCPGATSPTSVPLSSTM